MITRMFARTPGPVLAGIALVCLTPQVALRTWGTWNGRLSHLWPRVHVDVEYDRSADRPLSGLTTNASSSASTRPTLGFTRACSFARPGITRVDRARVLIGAGALARQFAMLAATAVDTYDEEGLAVMADLPQAARRSAAESRPDQLSSRAQCPTTAASSTGPSWIGAPGSDAARHVVSVLVTTVIS